MTSENPEWPFDSPPNVACLTVQSIVDGTKPILLVTRDQDDGMWQFLTGDVVNTAEAIAVSLKDMVLRDSTLLHLADVELGWMAWRDDRDAPWGRRVIEDQTN
ncbi:hypothetical protein [Cupriavidus sp. WS]|uniref:hypothetical protein n=1 Tax=Cupriavidus sp. WS TaxID=1312922 RepID=UPI0009DBC76D|nr:hypothetical protein [Cupriavidus sp. WS]